MNYERRCKGRREHNPMHRGYRVHQVAPDKLTKLVGGLTGDELRAEAQAARRAEIAREHEQINAAIKARREKEHPMTVSLYKSTANGSREIVVQTNAQSLDVFISGLSDALDAAIRVEPELTAQTVAATLKNAFPVAFAISGYKAEKVSESKLLTCGFASPDASELVAQSKV